MRTFYSTVIHGVILVGVPFGYSKVIPGGTFKEILGKTLCGVLDETCRGIFCGSSRLKTIEVFSGVFLEEFSAGIRDRP